MSLHDTPQRPEGYWWSHVSYVWVCEVERWVERVPGDEARPSNPGNLCGVILI